MNLQDTRCNNKDNVEEDVYVDEMGKEMESSERNVKFKQNIMLHK